MPSNRVNSRLVTSGRSGSGVSGTVTGSPAGNGPKLLDALNLSNNLPKEARNVRNEFDSSKYAANELRDSDDFQSYPANNQAALFDFNRGFAGTQPVVLLVSEFLSLYQNNEKSDVGRAIQLKFDSKNLSYKTALGVLLQTPGLSDFVNDKKKSLTEFISTEEKILRQITSSTKTVFSLIDLSSFKDFTSTAIDANNGNAIPSARSRFDARRALPTINNSDIVFRNFLSEIGYSTPGKFSNTKIWQQSLIELKKYLLCHSDTLLGKQVNPINDIYTYQLYTGRRNLNRILLNPYLFIPDVETFFEQLSNTETVMVNYAAGVIKLFKDLDKVQYYDLSTVNNIIVDATDPTQKKLLSSDISKLAESYSSNSLLKPYKNNGRDISIIANAIIKELNYSLALADENNSLTSKLLSKYGYTVSNEGDNLQLWDYVIGRSSGNVLTIPSTPIGNGKSLISISQNSIVGNDAQTYQVLTFEKDRIVSSNKNFTPGSIFYLESSLSTVGRENDFSRLDSLINSTYNGVETLDGIYSFFGYELSGNQYRKKEAPSESTLSGIIEKLSIVSKFYKSCFSVNSLSTNTFDPSREDLTSQTLAGLEKKVSLNKSKLAELSRNESVGIRLASILCKFAVEPKQDNNDIAPRLKILLFLWLLLTVKYEVHNNSLAAKVAGDVKKQISNLLFSVGNANTNPQEIATATEEARTYPVILGSNLTKADDIKSGETKKAFEGLIDDAYQNLYKESIANRLFGETGEAIDSRSGLWKTLIECLKNLYTNNSIYRNNKTRYSGISKTAYLYSYFDLLLRIVALQTPEDYQGIYDTTYSYTVPLRGVDASFTTTTQVNVGTSLGPVFQTVTTETKERKELTSISIKESGILISKTDDRTLTLLVDQTLLNNAQSSIYSKKLSNSLEFLDKEERKVFDSLKIFMNYLKTLNSSLLNFKNVLKENMKNHVNNVSGFFDPTSLLGDANKTQESDALFNLSMSKNQMMLNRYVIDEYKDRWSTNADLENKIKLKSPEFSDFSPGFSDLLSINDIEVVSYDVLSSFFKSVQFQKIKSNNKKIVSVGIPPKFFESLTTDSKFDDRDAIKNNILRLRLFKIDRLRPTIVYKPQVYLFEMNRFPTRMLSNWTPDALDDESINLLKIPTKLYDAKSNSFLKCKDYSEAYPDIVYSNSSLTNNEKLQIYANHTKSFLAEEYLRWLTDTRFDEARYYKYSNFAGLTLVEQQYGAYLKYLGTSSTNQAGGAGGVATNNSVSFLDPLSQQTYTLALGKISNSNVGSGASAAVKTSGQLTRNSEKNFNLNLDPTMKLFFQSETILSDENLELQKKSVIPKKFDRIFNVIFDPDDFEVDGTVGGDTLNKAEASGLIVKQGGVYKHRDTTVDDVTFDEYFATIEPYAYSGL